mmetsp:Transcript_25701/g.42773  ORF Transcript_25701/g.42773 Transcript_25701/m.42773 type:complete len:408 (+) Transcript_25701:80-1303(+)
MRKKGSTYSPIAGSAPSQQTSSRSAEKVRRHPYLRRVNRPVFFIALVLVVGVCASHFVLLTEGDGKYAKATHSDPNNLKLVVKEGKDVKICAVFQVYNHIKRYEEEVQSSIARLKKMNPDVTTILITDNSEIGRGQDGSIDVLKVINDKSLLRLVGINDFTTRLKYLSTIFSWGPDCDMVMSLDSHVTVCSSDLRKRLIELYDDPSFQIGTNVEHNPYPSWKSTPFTFDPEYGGKLMPHNFAIVIRNSPQVLLLLEKWYQYMTSWATKLMTGFDADDQKPLQKLLSRSDLPSLTRLKESFAMAEKSVHKRRFGFYPRFTYALEGNVTMIHSHRKEGIPDVYRGDMCKLVNSDRRPRMLIRQEGNSTHPGLYRLVFDANVCQQELANFEKRICTDPAQTYGLQSAKSW